ncbi:heat shock 70 kDa protein 18-like [Silene latifolia]|uniref:heat shock 70 kDa protein 18-like n=1 Tax=Silene latifolia TaxID=37657 RepID=UPI003D78416A
MAEKNNEKAATVPIGIDLGTTYSCVAVWQNGCVEIIANDQGNRTTPSCVAFSKTERLVGDAAKNQASLNPINTIFDSKRLIGRQFCDKVVQDYIKLWPFKVVAGNPDSNNFEKKPMIVVTYKGKEKQFAPEEISAMILGKMKDVAEAYIGSKVKDAVVTVPARFNNLQRQATKDAGAIAGLNVIRIINEPTAAAIAYGFDNKGSTSSKKNVMVFDLGGGTFDVSLVAVDKESFEVKSVSGDTHLGGEDFDNRLIKQLVTEFQRKHGKDITGNSKAIGRLRAACERAKRILSSTSLTNIDIDCLFDGIDFSTSISRARFEKLNLDLFESCIDLIDQCLKDAGLKKADVHEVVLVGGSTRIPKVQELLQAYFPGKKLCKNINPDEAVAYGAAAHAAVLTGADSNDFVITDVAPLSLGIENDTGKMSVLIKRNTPIPVKEEKLFTTTADNQAELEFCVYEGEKRKARHNNLLGSFNLSGIPPSKKRALGIKAWFEIDQDGILKCNAEELSSGSKNGITITDHSGKLSNDQVKAMRKDNAKFNTEDEKRRKKQKAMNDLESYARDMKLLVNREGHKIVKNDRRKMEDAIEQTLQWLDWNVLLKMATKFEAKMKELKNICEPIIANMHQQPEANPSNASEIEIIELD